jgi:large subunit ribosomal protein L24
MHIRKDDIVQVLTGDDKGKRGRVLRVLNKTGKVLVEGVNKVYKHLKPSRNNQQGGRLSKEMPVDI